MGAKQLDDLVQNMDACSAAVDEIDRQSMELRFAAPDDPTLPTMNRIVENCKGMNSKNILDVKGKMKAVGQLSFIGHAGVNKVSFQGVLSSSKRLAPARYALVIGAVTSAGSAQSVTRKFTILS